MTSCAVGKRPACAFEKIGSPSAQTSKMPSSPFTSSASTPSSCFSVAARPTACGR